MNYSKWRILFGCVVVLAFALIISTGCTKKVEEQESEQKQKQEAVKREEKVELVSLFLLPSPEVV